MFRSLIAAAAALLVTACASSRSIEMQNPALGYKAADKVIVGVLDARPEVKDGQPLTFAGATNGFGNIRIWTVADLTKAGKANGGLTMSRYMAERIAAGIKGGGADVAVVNALWVPSDDKAEELMASEGAGFLLTIVNHKWSFRSGDYSQHGWFFDSDVEVVVQKRGKGTVLRKRAAAIKALGTDTAVESPFNKVVDGFKLRLEEILTDPEVVDALTN